MNAANESQHNESFSVDDLEIPIYLQNENYTCVPCCIKMIIDYYSKNNSINIAKISECVNTTELGTCNDSNLDNINKLIENFDPSLEFYRDCSYPSWNDILTDLKEDKPVILWIEYDDGLDKYFIHSIIVIGVIDNVIKYIDPIFGVVTDSIGSLLEKWEAVDRFTIRVKYGDKKKKKITEYLNMVGDNNE